ncbi:MAG: MBL fold metallo-hydrolase [Paludibacteraceae bacterium]|nr:MBL fold metallo-hydrolase [Paludibacteraceae bacterium]
MLQVKSFVFGPFQTNTYVVNDEQGNLLLIDPACYTEYEKQQLLNYINHQLPITNHQLSIIATHGHLDHLWGAAWACRQWNTSVLIPDADIPMVEAMQDQYDLFGIPLKAEPFPIRPLNCQLSIVNCQLIPTPGHTPGSVCLYFPNPQSPLLFSGDTLFRMGYGRTDLPGGNYLQLIQSLKTLLTLPPETKVYAGHGEPTTIAAEQNAYL